jgi:hypothetical protein
MLDQPLVVRILDGSSRPVSQAAVEFSFVGDLPGAGLEPGTVLTDDNGRASAVVRLAAVTGEQLIVARVSDTEAADLRAHFRATAVAPDDGGGDGGGKKGNRGKGRGHDFDDDD